MLNEIAKKQKEEFIAKTIIIKKYIKVQKELLTVLKTAALKFDGKILNKRFFEFIDETIPKSENYKAVVYRDKNAMDNLVFSIWAVTTGASCSFYTPEPYAGYNHIYISVDKLITDKRINFEKARQAITEYIEELTIKENDIDYAIKEFDNFYMLYIKLAGICKDLDEKVPKAFSDSFCMYDTYSMFNRYGNKQIIN